jgi:large subunit ribosomal protein L18
MSVKNDSRLRRARKSRQRMRTQGVNRLSVHRTPRHIYAQVFAPGGDRCWPALRRWTAASRRQHGQHRCGKRPSASSWPSVPSQPVSVKVAFDRSGYKYHGRVKALADAAREGGLEF